MLLLFLSFESGRELVKGRVIEMYFWLSWILFVWQAFYNWIDDTQLHNTKRSGGLGFFTPALTQGISLWISTALGSCVLSNEMTRLD